MANYIDNLEFHNLLKEYKETKSKRTYNKLGKYFLEIATNFLNKSQYINYTQDRKNDMISEALYDMCRYIDGYDVERMDKIIARGGTPNPFSYFSNFSKNGANRIFNTTSKDRDVIVKITFIDNFDKKDIYE